VTHLLRRHPAILTATAVALTALWIFAVRLVLDVPWGFADLAATGASAKAGILTNAGDAWSYLSWVQQYLAGATRVEVLYTTTPHEPLLWIFPLWLMGKCAALTGLPVLGVYNVLGVAGALAAVWGVGRIAAALGWSPRAQAWSIAALVLGSGGSWAWHLGHKAGLASRADGGDLFFLDLFPSTALLVYPYHALSLALLAGLWWSASSWENRLVAAAPAARWGGVTFAFALALGFSRPYEPAALLGAWGIKTAWHFLQRRRDPAAARAACWIAVVMALGIAPGLGWSWYVSRQPVWNSFAQESLALGLGRGAWLVTLAGWLVLAGCGARAAARNDSRTVILPAAATLLLVIILVGAGATQAKLASGLLFGPILLAGRAADAWFAAAEQKGPLLRFAVLPVTMIALGGLPSLYMNLHAFLLQEPARVDSELAQLAVMTRGAGRPPVVLTDNATGAILPGLVGARVWCGHWSLTDNYREKVARLRAAGLDPATPTEAPVELAAILRDAPFDFALLDRRCGAVIAELTQRHWLAVADTTRWQLLRAPARAGGSP
jgi:hypothetical protein